MSYDDFLWISIEPSNYCWVKAQNDFPIRIHAKAHCFARSTKYELFSYLVGSGEILRSDNNFFGTLSKQERQNVLCFYYNYYRIELLL